MSTLSQFVAPQNVTTAENTQTLTNKTLQAANLTGATLFGGSAGTAGQVLTSNGAGQAPSYQAGFSTGKAIAMAVVFGG